MVAAASGLVLLAGVIAAIGSTGAAPMLPTASPSLAAMYQVASVAAAATKVGSEGAGACSGEGWQQRRGQAAAAQLRYVAATRTLPVEFRAARAGVLGMADLHAGSVDVYVKTCATQSDELLRHVIAHELGHVLDELTMTEERRAAWLAARGIPAGTPWYGCSACEDFATPAGDFAEVYAQWATGETRNHSALAAAPASGDVERLAEQFFGA